MEFSSQMVQNINQTVNVILTIFSGFVVGDFLKKFKGKWTDGLFMLAMLCILFPLVCIGYDYFVFDISIFCGLYTINSGLSVGMLRYYNDLENKQFSLVIIILAIFNICLSYYTR